MKKLTVLFDAQCGVCLRSAMWLRWQAQYIELELLPSTDPQVQRRYPMFSASELRNELTVVADTGEVYRGPKAFIMCLYALKRYRAWSMRLANPSLFPFAKVALCLLSKGRGSVNFILGLSKDEELRKYLEAARQSMPEVESCNLTYPFTAPQSRMRIT